MTGLPIETIVLVVTSRDALGRAYVAVAASDYDEVEVAMEALAKMSVLYFRPDTIAVDNATTSLISRISQGFGWTYQDNAWVPTNQSKIQFLNDSAVLPPNTQLQWWKLNAPTGDPDEVFNLNETSVTSPRRSVFALVPEDGGDELIFLGVPRDNYNSILTALDLLRQGFVIERWTQTGMIIRELDSDFAVSDIQGLAEALGWRQVSVEQYPFLPEDQALANEALDGSVLLLVPDRPKGLFLGTEPIIRQPTGLVWAPVPWAD